MPTRHHSLLIGHGAVVFILGLAAGVPFLWALDAIAAGGGAVEAEALRAWRMAHLEGTLNGMMMIAVAAAATQLTLGEARSSIITWGLIATGWGNILASFVSGMTGGRGLAFTGIDWNTLTFTLFSIAIVGVIAAFVVLALAAFSQPSD
ncbi:MAG: hypothetical protein NXH87_00645 [Rhodobiaceae bacterium]|nr:hypothetical protein RHODOSMS8_03740 [Rhodobiaceae bacterium]MCR9239858.1 hypothetical protein [Rhodobiaceae bacterium]